MSNKQADAAAPAGTGPASPNDRPSNSGRAKGVVPLISRPFRNKGRSDVLIGGLGIALGVTCALFPWYIFFNQEKFGIRAVRFQGNGQEKNGPGGSAHTGGISARRENLVSEAAPFDLITTGVVLDRGVAPDAVPGVEEQPFPGHVVDFRLVHVANGRALMEDDSGLFIVQSGSRLPDNSHVARIEQHDGGWVLVTSEDRIIESQP